MHLLVDSTGLRLCGPGEWLVEKHGARTRRSWKKLHLGVDADTGEIIATTLTSHDVDDGSQVGPLLDQVNRPVASFTGDGAFDRDDVYDEVAARHPDAPVIVPPRSNAVPSKHGGDRADAAGPSICNSSQGSVSRRASLLVIAGRDGYARALCRG